jgi:hypothetical protein
MSDCAACSECQRFSAGLASVTAANKSKAQLAEEIFNGCVAQFETPSTEPSGVQLPNLQRGPLDYLTAPVNLDQVRVVTRCALHCKTGPTASSQHAAALAPPAFMLHCRASASPRPRPPAFKLDLLAAATETACTSKHFTHMDGTYAPVMP